jgi:polyisoprenoid-binding protein YceI
VKHLPSLLLLAAAPLLASPALAGTWTVDAAKSRIGFTGTQTGSKFTGSFGKFTATIDFDPAKPDAAHVAVDIETASAKTGDVQRDEAMPQPDWFDATKFPTAHFEATGFTPKGGDKYETTGKLTIRGMTQDVVLPFTLDINGGIAHAVGHADLIRTKFGVGQGTWADAQWVALEVGVDIDLAATGS